MNSKYETNYKEYFGVNADNIHLFLKSTQDSNSYNIRENPALFVQKQNLVLNP